MKKIILVGANGNLGPVWAKTILESGATLLCLGKEKLPDKNLELLLGKFPNSAKYREFDVRNRRVAEEPELNGSTYTGLVINSGIDSIPGNGKARITDYSYDEWVEILSVNVAGVANTINQFSNFLTANSSIVIIGSIYGLVSPNEELYNHYNSGEGTVKHPAYTASKSAIIGLCKQYATHLANSGIRVNLLTLGGFEGNQDREFVSKFNKKVPTGRMATSGDVVGALMFLLSPASNYVTGHNLIVDGGYTLF